MAEVGHPGTMNNTCKIIELIDRHAISEGATDTPIEGLQLFRTNHPVERLPGVYDPSICVIVQGQKRAYLDGTTHIYDREQYLCCTLPIPAEAEVIEAQVLGTSPIAGTKVRDIDFPEGSLIGGVMKDGEVVRPTGDMRIAEGDLVSIFALAEDVPEVEQLLQVSIDYF